MRVTFLVVSMEATGGAQRSVTTLASALSARHDVEILSVFGSRSDSGVDVDPRVSVSRVLAAPTAIGDRAAEDPDAARLIPADWEPDLTGQAEKATQQALAGLGSDVVVTTSVGMLALAVQCAPPTTRVAHVDLITTFPLDDEAPLIAFAPRADLLVAPTEYGARRLEALLGSTAPDVVVLQVPLEHRYRPRSLLDGRLIVSTGQLKAFNQFDHLVRAFGQIADDLPGWRLRIFGTGPSRVYLERVTRELKLFDRVELPGDAADMTSEWAKAAIGATTAKSNKLPVAAMGAAAAGVPMAAYDCPSGPRSVIEDGRTGLLVAPGSIRSMAAALQVLAHDADLRSRLGAAALAAAARLEPAALLPDWEQVLSGLMTAPSRRVELGARRERVEPLVGRPEVSEVSLGTPAQARAVALEWAARNAARATDTWFVIPALRRGAPVVVLPEEARDRFLDLLSGPGHPEGLDVVVDDEADEWPLESGPLVDMTRALRGRPRLSFTLRPPLPAEGASMYDFGGSVDVEFWPPEGEFLRAQRQNLFVNRLGPDANFVEDEICGVRVQTLDLMTRPTVHDRRFPIDVVYTWVDGGDPAWAARRADRLAVITGARPSVEAAGIARYQSRDELRYSMRSVHTFAPWVRHVYLVTDAQKPDWLDDSHPDVTVVDHRDILDARHLPVFNSHAIETGLHRIDGLSENFLYFNDDVFLGRSATPDLFFDLAGHTAVFFSPLVVGTADEHTAPYLFAALNNRSLLERDFGLTVTNPLLHTPHPLKRSVLFELEERYPEQFEATRSAPFRSSTDIAVASSLAQHYALATGRAFVGELETRYIAMRSGVLNRAYTRILRDREYDCFCLGDFHEYTMTANRVNQLTLQFMQDYFPIPAPWERS